MHPPAVMRCESPACRKPLTTKRVPRCSGCWAVAYCSAACVRHHWREHKASCRAVHAAAVHSAAAHSAAAHAPVINGAAARETREAQTMEAAAASAAAATATPRPAAEAEAEAEAASSLRKARHRWRRLGRLGRSRRGFASACPPRRRACSLRPRRL
mmetsp:Transcript_28577/g.70437  ORF Transcript_28577/g.70437 Transcript_28577/m.70437 type:complete len:157 (+) Transcript_28577:406-876(+)